MSLALMSPLPPRRVYVVFQNDWARAVYASKTTAVLAVARLKKSDRSRNHYWYDSVPFRP
jgi:hypothetical protein